MQKERKTRSKVIYLYLEIFIAGFNKGILHEVISNDEFSGNKVVTMLRQLKTFSEHCYNTPNRGCESSRTTSPLACDPLLPSPDVP